MKSSAKHFGLAVGP